MKKSKLTKVIALVLSCACIGVGAFAGCNKEEGETPDNGTIGTGNQEPGTNPGTDPGTNPGTNPGTTPGTNPGTNPGTTPGTTPSQDPVIPQPVAGRPEITKASNDELETAYVEWKAGTSNATWYEVYSKATTANNWVKLDSPLIRQYSDYYRADALGLKAGTYDMKVVPVDNQGAASEANAVTVEGIAVQAHDRAGYGFFGASASGAYNDDGTLRSGAQVFYITKDTAKTVKATVNKKGKPTEATGFQSIIDTRQSSEDKTPLCFRIVGTVTASDLDGMSSSSEGLQIKGTGDITIEGVGGDATIKDFGMLIRACNNVEVRNLGILNCIDDGISIDTDNTHLWIHNNDIFYGKGGSGDKAKGDGALDTKGSTLITHSYNHFWDCGKCNLQGMKSESTDYRITYHHNWYDHSDSRHPRIRTASVHVYNNYFDGNAKYGVGVTTGASAFVENNYFRSTAPMRPMMSSGQGTDADGDGTFSGESGGIIKSFNNKYDCTASNLKLKTYQKVGQNSDCYEATTRDEQVPNTVKTVSGGTTYNNFDTAEGFYEYTVHSADDAKTMVQRYAGRVDGGDLKWKFDNATEDKNYAVISALKTAVTNYKTTVVKIGGAAAGTTTGGTTTGGTTTGGEEGGENPVTPPASVDGEIVYVPQTDGTTKTGLTISGGAIKNGKATATIDGTAYSKTYEFDSSASIEFTAPADKDYTLKLYLSVASIKNNGKEAPSSAFKSESGYCVYTVTVAKGTKVTLSKKNTTQLFKLVLTPVA